MGSLRMAVLAVVLAGSAGTVGAQTPGTSQGAPSQECVGQFTAFRSEVEKRGMAAKRASEQHASREEMCKLVTEYGAAEANWIKFSESNMSKCSIPQEIVAQLKTVHVKTVDGRKKLCAAGAQLEDVHDEDENYRFGPPTEPKRLRVNPWDITGR